MEVHDKLEYWIYAQRLHSQAWPSSHYCLKPGRAQRWSECLQNTTLFMVCVCQGDLGSLRLSRLFPADAILMSDYYTVFTTSDFFFR